MRAPNKTGILTQRGLEALKPGESQADPAARGSGRLQARKNSSGKISFYYRYTEASGERVRLPLGNVTLAQARKRADELKIRYLAGAHDLRETLEAESVEREEAKASGRAASDAMKLRARTTLGVLLEAYIANMRKARKVSADSVLACFHRHVRDAKPKLWGKPAADVTADDLIGAVARLADAEKLREAAKLRSYLRAAFAAGLRARHSATAVAELRAIRLGHNPAADLATIENSNRPRERALTLAETQRYWARIDAMQGVDGALLRFHLLTGCQRVEQLSRLTVADVLDGDRIRIRDTKGRRSVARIHDVPLTAQALNAIAVMRSNARGDFVFTSTYGLQGASYAVVQNRVRGVCDAMLQAGELDGGPFTAGDLRRTVETRLAAVGISQEIRAQLQSHGLGGVQARHYDKHDYIGEKLRALMTFESLVRGASQH